MKNEQILWAVKIGDEDWQEQIISTNPDSFTQAKAWAKSNGFNRFRVSTLDLSETPDFTKTINSK